MTDELIDIYDIDMNPIGTATKSQAHNEGLWHKAFHCWIVRPAAQNHDKVWLQLRGKDKDIYPDLLDISSAGHIATGETAREAGVREIEKELGLKIDAESEMLTKLFTHTLAADYKDFVIREFNPTYILETEARLNELKLQPEEVDGIFEASLQDLLALFNNEIKTIKINGLLRNDDSAYTQTSREVAIADFAPHGCKYYIKVMEALDRYCEGKKYN